MDVLDEMNGNLNLRLELEKQDRKAREQFEMSVRELS